MVRIGDQNPVAPFFATVEVTGFEICEGVTKRGLRRMKSGHLKSV